jgi:hypothetical protein
MNFHSFSSVISRVIFHFNRFCNRFVFLIYSYSDFLNNKDVKRGLYVITPKGYALMGGDQPSHFVSSILKQFPRFYGYKFITGGSNFEAQTIHPLFSASYDFVSNKIVRKYKLNFDINKYIERRKTMSKYISAPFFSLNCNNSLEEEIVEDCIGYKSVKPLDLKYALKNTLEELRLLSCATMAERGTPKNVKKFILNIIYELNSLLASQELNIDLIMSLCVTNKKVLSKGKDLGAQNIIFKKNKVYFIDWEPHEIEFRPYWLDSTNLVIKTDLNGYWKGLYSKELKYLLGDDYAELPSGEDVESSLLLSTCIWNASEIHFLELSEFNFDKRNKYIIKGILEEYLRYRRYS